MFVVIVVLLLFLSENQKIITPMFTMEFYTKHGKIRKRICAIFIILLCFNLIMINKFNNPRIINFCSCIPFVLLKQRIHVDRTG